MLAFEKQVIFDINKCQQCGTCLTLCPVNAITSRLKLNGLSEILIDKNKCTVCQKCITNCPSNAKDELSNSLSSLPDKRYYLGYNKNQEIQLNASSGGVARTLLIEGLRSGIIDGAYTLKSTQIYPYCEGEYYHKNNIPGYQEIPNSVYHSVLVNQNLSQIKKTDRLMVIGTSCQLKGLERILSGKYNELIKVCIFCKQQKTIESTQFLAKVMGTKISIDKKFSFKYRGNGWPGKLEINNLEIDYDVAARIPFGRRLWTVPGCNICSTPFGVNVDITLLDPWKIEKDTKLGKTLTIAHTQEGNQFLNNISEINLEIKSYAEIEDALDLNDIKRKQKLVPYFRGEACSTKINFAGHLEQFQRWYLKCIVTILPRMPIAFYKILNKIPDLRNLTIH